MKMEVKKGNRFPDRTGEKYITNQGYEVEITDYVTCKNMTIIFNDKKKTVLKNVRYGDLKKGNIRNPNHPSKLGIGYIGQGCYLSSLKGDSTRSYIKWFHILERGYCKKYKNKKPTYKNVTVCEEWHNFQNFAKWFEENYVEGFDLDKDILVKGNKMYSPETCCFVPQEINALFTKSDKMRGKLLLGVSYHSYGMYQVSLSMFGKQLYCLLKKAIY